MSTDESNRKRQAKFYEKNKDKKKRRLLINRIKKGKLAREVTILEYGVTMSDFDDTTTIHPTVLNILQGNHEPLESQIQPDLTRERVNLIYDEFAYKNDLTEKTLNTYNTRLSYVRDLLTGGVNDAKFFTVLKQAPDESIMKIKDNKPQNYVDYLSPIISLSKYSPEFCIYMCDSLQKYVDAYNEGREVVGKHMLRRMSTSNVIEWGTIVEMRNNIEKETPYSSEHLLISLMTLMPTLRDDFGKMRLKAKLPITTKFVDNIYNFYHIPSGRIYLYDYKGCRMKKLKIIDVPVPLQEIINESIKQNPRDWMITKNCNTTNEIYAGGNLSNLVTQLYGFNINDIRHSLDTYIHNNPALSPGQILAIEDGMLHSARMGWLYVRDTDIIS